MFNMLIFLRELASQLANVQEAKRVQFSCWAAERVLVRAYDPLLARIGASTLASLELTLARLRESAADGKSLPEEVLLRWRSTCENFEWEPAEGGIEAMHADFLAAEAVEAAMRAFEVGLSKSPEAAAHAAERMLNCIDFELQMVKGVENSTEHELFQEEVRAQKQKLDELRR